MNTDLRLNIDLRRGWLTSLTLVGVLGLSVGCSSEGAPSTTLVPTTSRTVSATTPPPTSVATSPVTSTGSPPATSSHAQTAGEVCHALAWPLPAPDFRAQTLLQTITDNYLFCFNIDKAVAPNGHNVADDPMNQAGNWTVVAQEPAPKTPVGETAPIVLHVVPKMRS